MIKVYLALPYTKVEEKSYELANRATIYLLKKGLNVFSPITHSHPLSSELPGTWDFWEKIDYQFIDWCDVIIYIDKVGKIPYTESTGVTAELKYAKEKNIPCIKLSTDTGKFTLNEEELKKFK